MPAAARRRRATRSASSWSTISPRSSPASRLFRRFSGEQGEKLVARAFAMAACDLAGAARVLAGDGAQQRAMLGDDVLDAARAEPIAHAQRLDQHAAASEHAH